MILQKATSIRLIDNEESKTEESSEGSDESDGSSNVSSEVSLSNISEGTSDND